ncbi:MAG: hypothetical protein ACPHUL_01120 [Marinomonas gallaica]
MDTKTFFEWLNTCPSNERFISDIDDDVIRVIFIVDNQEWLQEEQKVALQNSLRRHLKPQKS